MATDLSIAAAPTVFLRYMVMALAATCAILLGAARGHEAQARSTLSCAGGPMIDPMALYGERLAFDVFRNDRPVGRHVVAFSRNGDVLKTRTRFDVEVDILFFTAYRYVYESTATWRNGCLQSLAATTNDNGEQSRVSVQRQGNELLVSGPRGTASTGAATLPTEHWNVRVVNDRAVINTITGRINAVDLTPLGVERINAADGASLEARHYAYRGELNNEVWYDGDGRWVKMRFPGKDGSIIEYVCVTCTQGDPSESRS